MEETLYVIINNNDEYRLIQDILFIMGYRWHSQKDNGEELLYLEIDLGDEVLIINIITGRLLRKCRNSRNINMTIDEFLGYIENNDIRQ